MKKKIYMSEDKAITKPLATVTYEPEKELPRISKMLWDIMALAIPAVISFLFACFTNIGTFAVIRRLDPKYTGALGLGSAISAFISFVSGMDTLIPQSFGKKDYSMCGVYMNRGIVIFTVIGIPLNIVVLFSTQILGALSVERSMAELAGLYAICLIPNMVLTTLTGPMTSFMSGQRVVIPNTIIGCSIAILQPFIVLLFVNWLNQGYLGVAYASGVSAALSLILSAVYIYKSDKFIKAIAPWNEEVFKGWKSFIGVCGHSGIMSCLAAWGYHIMSFFAGQLTTEEMAAHVALLNVLAWLYAFTVGFGNAATTLVGNKLGENNVPEAKAYAKVCLITNFSFSVVGELLALIFRNQIGQLFSSDAKVQEIVSSVVPVIVIANIFDVNQGVFSRIIYGLGKQKYASIVLLISHWAVRIPIAVITTFVFKMGLYGLWTTYIFSYACAAIGFAYLVIKEDWYKVVREIHERIENDKATLEK